jgi:hypothetical protein
MSNRASNASSAPGAVPGAHATRLFVCLSVHSESTPWSHLLEWLVFHRRVGVSHFFVHVHGDHAAALGARLTSASTTGADVTLVRPTVWPTYFAETDTGLGFSARYVGQLDALHRCVDAASSAARPHGGDWLANLDLDEFLMPASAAAVDRPPLRRLPRVLANFVSADTTTTHLRTPLARQSEELARHCATRRHQARRRFASVSGARPFHRGPQRTSRACSHTCRNGCCVCPLIIISSSTNTRSSSPTDAASAVQRIRDKNAPGIPRGSILCLAT